MHLTSSHLTELSTANLIFYILQHIVTHANEHTFVPSNQMFRIITYLVTFYKRHSSLELFLHIKTYRNYTEQLSNYF